MRSKVIVSLLFMVATFCIGFTNVYANDIDATAIYAESCALCHGPDGKGTSIGLEFGVHDFTDKEWQATRNEDEFVNSITNGNPDNDNYLSFGDSFDEETIKAMAGHVRTFAH